MDSASLRDRAVLEHGIETGHLRRLPSGEFIEIHQPLGGVDSHGHPIPLDYQGAPVPKRMNQLGYAGKAIVGVLKVKETYGDIDHHASSDIGGADNAVQIEGKGGEKRSEDVDPDESKS